MKMNKGFKLIQFHKFETLIFKIENLKHAEKLVCITYKTYTIEDKKDLLLSYEKTCNL